MDIIGRGMKLVDRLIIGVAVSEAKKPLFSLEERIALMEEECGALEGPGRAKIEVKPFDMLLMHFAEQEEVNVIVRGLRAVSDFEYEFQMTAMNEQLNREIETVFLMADVKHQAVASRLVKEIARFGGDITPFVTPRVKERLLEKFR
jgi:pantetheine-phosphate adenylyltransferase